MGTTSITVGLSLTGVRDRSESNPACCGYRWIFSLATYYADLNGRVRPEAAVRGLSFNVIQVWNIMERSLIDSAWPNALRWFLSQGLTSFTPWHFIQTPDEMTFAADAFRREDVSNGKVFVFARRQDCDDFAGLELVGGDVTDKVVTFHPVFGESSKSSPRTWNIVTTTYDDVFEFVAQCVVPEMKDWALTEDATDL